MLLLWLCGALPINIRQWLLLYPYGTPQLFRSSGCEVAVLKTGGLKVFNSFGFIALVVFMAVLLTSVSLSVPAGRKPVAAELSPVHAHMTPSAQPFEQLIRQHRPRN